MQIRERYKERISDHYRVKVMFPDWESFVCECCVYTTIWSMHVFMKPGVHLLQTWPNHASILRTDRKDGQRCHMEPLATGTSLHGPTCARYTTAVNEGQTFWTGQPSCVCTKRLNLYSSQPMLCGSYCPFSLTVFTCLVHGK